MDMKKSRLQYRLKGATRIPSENQIEEPNKTGEQQQESNVDSTTTTNSGANQTSLLDEHQQSAVTHGSNSLQGLARLNQGQSQQQNMMFLSAGSDSTMASPSSSQQAQQTVGFANSLQSSSSSSQQQPAFRMPQILPCDIKSLFECPICFDYAVPPIYQCQNGHLVCQGCSSKISHCPTCRVAISEPTIRNLQLDRLASTFQFPCKYNFNGCQWKSYWFKKRDHEESCEFVSYSCPCPGTTCKWTGLLTQVMPHLSEHHKSITTLSGEDIVFLATDINLKGAVDWVMIQSCFNHHFLLVLEKQELKTGQQQFFAVVQLIGSQREADKFRYKLELSSNSAGQVRRLQWEATPRSILDGIQLSISTYDCLAFDSKMAQHFLSPIQKDKDASQPATNEGQGENLGINVTIDRLI